MNQTFLRLPRGVWPTQYQIELHVDVDQPTFRGTVDIHLEVRDPMEKIVLHGRDMEIQNAQYRASDGAVHGLACEVSSVDQTLRFCLAQGGVFSPGIGVLNIAYQAPISAGLQGLYRAQDMHERALCTQCQPTDARGIFPCFDEPEFKASVQWTLHTPAGVLALTNGALQRHDDVAGGQRWEFAPTRKVSSYLAALVVGEFESNPPTHVHGVPLSVYAWKGKTAQTEYATRLTADLLPFYEAYFGQRYPYGKYDQVAVPGFDAGAMENIGLVLFRQNALLLNPKTASWRQEKRVATVVAHEFAHMWFGNWVTMRWWDDLWLNEAFAEWMCHKALDAVRPDFQIWDDFQESRQQVLGDDAMPTTHPIWTPVETPAQATELFDSITYQKGCAVMRMLEQFLGADVFQRGLQAYMQKFGESNASGADLWGMLAEASNQDVPALMHSWIAQAGFPVVSVEETGVPGQLLLTQKRFFGSALDQAIQDDTLWRIPLVIRFEDASGVHVHKHVLEKKEEKISIDAHGDLRWCHMNAGEVGFYRTHYAPALLERLFTHLQQMQPVEQVGLLEDQWALLRSGQGDVGLFVRMLDLLLRSSSRQVFTAVRDRLAAVESILEEQELTDALEQFRRWVAARVDGSPLPTREDALPAADMEYHAARFSMLARLAQLPTWIEQAAQLEQRERAQAGSIEPNLVGVALSAAAYFGDDERYEALLQTYVEKKKRGDAPQETLRYLYVLPLFQEPRLVEKTLDLIDQGIVPQDNIRFVLGLMLGLPHACEQAWAYMVQHWVTLQPKVGDLGISRLVESVGGLPFEKRQEIVDFFAKHPPEKGERALARALKHMDQHHELCQRLAQPLAKSFS